MGVLVDVKILQKRVQLDDPIKFVVNVVVLPNHNVILSEKF